MIRLKAEVRPHPSQGLGQEFSVFMLALGCWFSACPGHDLWYDPSWL